MSQPSKHPPSKSIALLIAREINATPAQATSAIELLDEGATVPFIARYRKEVTGGLDDTQLRTLAERLVYLRELEARRLAILDSIRSQDKLTAELEGKIAAVTTKAELEDIYLPYKPKRRTKAEIARERGLGPLAESILSDRTVAPADRAAAYVVGEVTDVKMALEGAREYHRRRHHVKMPICSAACAATCAASPCCARAWSTASRRPAPSFPTISIIPNAGLRCRAHRALAMLRGWNEEFLSVDITVDLDDTSPVKPVERTIAAAYQVGGTLPGDKWLMEMIGWTWRVKLSLSLSLDLMRELRERSEEEAIHVFARNLKDLLLAAPAGSRATMGLDPGIRTGVKVAVD